jgi:hypothetical protein
MSTARMLRSEPWALFSAWRAASSVETFELPTNSMIFTTATGPSSIGCLEWTFYPLSATAAGRPTRGTA